VVVLGYHCNTSSHFLLRTLPEPNEFLRSRTKTSPPNRADLSPIRSHHSYFTLAIITKPGCPGKPRFFAFN
jgi:hypothetical protein